MIHRNTNKFVMLAALAAGVLITAVMFTGQLNAQDQAPSWQNSSEQNSTSKESSIIGTYDPQAAFEQHPLQEKLMEFYASIQEETQKAQQQENQQKLRQLQQQFEQQRNQVIEQFHQDVEKALPEAAEAAGVKIIALEIAYTANDITPQDVTEQIVETFTEKDGEKTAGQQF
ncbi:hypothetical protein SMSP2_02203 [Limihaloglobus sulfuriphilus]|uniref:Outer membrane protein n=1 Tax=Limihaloglobus sulfuriphilus TaxID=1851148 RepID=A0A1Q2MGP8_9BACT|nr:hypothetical protein [Limihaloglobus sulfuriphilus]AQQ71824.1 hypothetical protein SMSP2_02203 [Limihaloglobus sulfuriphilus]